MASETQHRIVKKQLLEEICRYLRGANPLPDGHRVPYIESLAARLDLVINTVEGDVPSDGEEI